MASKIEVGSLVEVVKGGRAGQSFVVEGILNGFGHDAEGNAVKLGNLRLIAESEPVAEPIVEGAAEQVAPVAEKPVRLCACGCEIPIVAKRSIYRQGHDQRHKGLLLNTIARDPFGDDGEAAADLLVAKGWKTREEIEIRRVQADRKLNPAKYSPVVPEPASKEIQDGEGGVERTESAA